MMLLQYRFFFMNNVPFLPCWGHSWLLGTVSIFIFAQFSAFFSWFWSTFLKFEKSGSWFLFVEIIWGIPLWSATICVPLRADAYLKTCLGQTCCWNVRCEMRDARCEMRDVRCEMRDLNARCEMWNERWEMWDVRLEMWDVRLEKWHVGDTPSCAYGWHFKYRSDPIQRGWGVQLANHKSQRTTLC